MTDKELAAALKSALGVDFSVEFQHDYYRTLKVGQWHGEVHDFVATINIEYLDDLRLALNTIAVTDDE